MPLPLFLLVAAAMGAPAADTYPDEYPPPLPPRDPSPGELDGYALRPTRKRPPWPSDVPCPRCKAAVGEQCDKYTRGRHPFHLARVEALEAKAREMQAAGGAS